MNRQTKRKHFYRNLEHIIFIFQSFLNNTTKGAWQIECSFSTVMTLNNSEMKHAFFKLDIGLHLSPFNPFMQNVEKWPNILLNSCGVTVYLCLAIFNIMHEKVKRRNFRKICDNFQPVKV